MRRRRRARRLRRTLGVLAALIICGVLLAAERLGPDTTVPADGDGAEGGPEHIVDTQTQPPEEPPIEETPAVVVLDAGHGGVQSGCEFEGVLEKDITLAVTLLAAKRLEDLGVTVILTRDSDEDVSLDDRCTLANGAGADLFVSIHCNSFTEDASVSGFEGYYHLSDDGKRLAEYIMEAASALSVKTRRVKDADYQVLRETNMPSALMEIGFMSNPDERDRLQTAEYQSTIADAIADGVMKMLNN